MNKLEPLTEIPSFDRVALDLNSALKHPDNSDIVDTFPATVDRYGQELVDAVRHLEEARDGYRVGIREQFIVFAGETATGMCVIRNDLKIQNGIDPSVANISGFICRPHRGRGLGRFSIEERMKVVERNFNNQAWTFVKDGNTPSEHLVMDVGFRRTDRQVEGWEDHHLYIYGDVE